MKNVKYLIILVLSLFCLQAYSQGYNIVLKDGRTATVRADETEVIAFSKSVNTKAGTVTGYEISLKDGRSVAIGVEETESFTFTTDADLKTDISALEDIAVTSITLSSSSLTVTEGDEAMLTATILPTNATDNSVTWSSSDESIATVSDEGVVSAKSAGSATITVTANDGSGVKATCDVTVEAKTIYVTNISIDYYQLTMTEGDEETLIATVTPSDAMNTSVTWSSSDESVATVSNIGVVTAVSAGTATITATADDGSDVKGTCYVTVEAGNSAGGHEYVDLGLSVKWATMNVGATEVAGSSVNTRTGQLDCYGEFYAWGETSPKDEYQWSNYAHYSQIYSAFTKYCTDSYYGPVDNKIILDPEDDAATVNWGEGWRMPTPKEMKELQDNCYWEWTKSYNNSDVEGYIIYKVKDDSDKGMVNNGYYSVTTTTSYSLADTHIFLPATGYRDGADFVGNYGGCYWMSTHLYSHYVDYLNILSYNIKISIANHYYGFSVRPVYLSPSDVITVSSIEISKTSLSLAEGEAEYLTTTAYPSNATNPYVIWTSSNESVATVSMTGFVTTKSVGTATITAIAIDGSGAKATCSVTVEAATPIEHEYVDLGLSVKWATMNVGATEVAGSKYNAHTGKLSCYGEYYAWGETSPKDDYSWTTYTLCNGTYDSLTKYCTDPSYGTVDGKTVLEPEDDAAHVNWGGNWRMPTSEEQNELLNYCYWEWTESYNNSGVTGYIVYKTKDDSDRGKQNNLSSYSETPTASYSLADTHIFLPAAGVRHSYYIYYDGIETSLFSSTLSESGKNFAEEIYLINDNVQTNISDRKLGLPIRPVYATLASSISLSTTSLTLFESEAATISATVSPAEASNKNLIWTSSDESVATVSSEGNITAVSAGTATITATANDGSGVTATCSVTVKAAASIKHEYVDLGISVKWATMNLGALEVAGTKINAHTGQLSCYGEYYAWGETKPKDNYDWKTYTLCNGTYNSMTKYCTDSDYGTVDGKTVLDPEDDAARANWGKEWRMPTMEELDELAGECYWEWTDSYNNSGVTGYIVYKAKNDSDKGKAFNTGSNSKTPTASYSLADIHIFLPAAGTRYYSSFNVDVGSWGVYLSSAISEYNPNSCCGRSFDSENVYSYIRNRSTGQIIRPVHVTPVSSLSLSSTSLTMFEGDTKYLAWTMAPDDADNLNVIWTSSDESVATVDDGGKITAVSAGTATITATAADGSGVTATCSVTVKTPVKHDYVDLGLSVKWATMNVGATEVAGSKINSHTGKLDCYGEYYAWAETSPKETYDWTNLKYCIGDTDKGPFTKYVTSSTYGTVDNKTVLEPNDDAASANWGGSWRMPTIDEMNELIKNCYWEWTNSYNNSGAKGYIVYKAKNASDKGKQKHTSSSSQTTIASYSLADTHIFLPAAGYRYSDRLNDAGSWCDYATSSLGSSKSGFTPSMAATPDLSNVWTGDDYRRNGQSVRAVCP